MPKILPNIRENILEEGKKVLTNYGYDCLNIRTLAKNCNIGIGTFYNYFSNKDKLIIEIIRTDWAKALIPFNKIINSPDYTLKYKLKIIYNDIDLFLNNYMTTFLMLVSKGKKCSHNKEILYPVCEAINKTLIYHKNKGDINPSLTCDKLSKILLNNIIFIAKEKDITFEDLYNSFKF
ncbi:TetR/AcrR family transcriptional regulator [Clostridium fallax]|uniref:Transcriptional regulator, TetR family n=1 Tax=Clostridium fallax TaxID=1533 RepID=A0A1M4W3J0_9CLOT|nr:TetR/AcrR family transcriptional regulator [Clostridium fallax]SHE75786.1 transcriptional regulator, TetR family [Clostridium fallax]SQB22861.1 transcriptional regulator, TetR family [Clostridium fallax]